MKYSDFYDKYKNGLILEYKGRRVNWVSHYLFNTFNQRTGDYDEFRAFDESEEAVEIIPVGATHRNLITKRLYKIDGKIIMKYSPRFGGWFRTHWNMRDLKYFSSL